MGNEEGPSPMGPIEHANAHPSLDDLQPLTFISLVQSVGFGLSLHGKALEFHVQLFIYMRGSLLVRWAKFTLLIASLLGVDTPDKVSSIKYQSEDARLIVCTGGLHRHTASFDCARCLSDRSLPLISDS